MNQLQTINNNLHEFVTLRLGHKSVKDLDVSTLKRQCVKIITRAFTYSTPNGITEPKILAFQSNELFNCLKGNLGSLTIPEVQRAFFNGLNNEYGQYFGMCAKTYNQFLKGFISNPDRSKQWSAYLDSLERPKLDSKNSTVNPEMQKRVIDVLKQYVDNTKPGYIHKVKPLVVKSERDLFIQQCFNDFYKLKKEELAGKEFVEFEGNNLDETEYVQARLKEYDLTNKPL